jgi:lactobin A/cerein 7B family class IIb bacteriocin
MDNLRHNNDLRALEDHELETVSGGIWPLALVAIAVAVVVLEGTGTSTRNQS